MRGRKLREQIWYTMTKSGTKGTLKNVINEKAILAENFI